jgi:hypothetical protein
VVLPGRLQPGEPDGDARLELPVRALHLFGGGFAVGAQHVPGEGAGRGQHGGVLDDPATRDLGQLVHGDVRGPVDAQRDGLHEGLVPGGLGAGREGIGVHLGQGGHRPGGGDELVRFDAGLVQAQHGHVPFHHQRCLGGVKAVPAIRRGAPDRHGAARGQACHDVVGPQVRAPLLFVLGPDEFRVRAVGPLLALQAQGAEVTPDGVLRGGAVRVVLVDGDGLRGHGDRGVTGAQSPGERLEGGGVGGTRPVRQGDTEVARTDRRAEGGRGVLRGGAGGGEATGGAQQQDGRHPEGHAARRPGGSGGRGEGASSPVSGLRTSRTAL